MRENEEKKGMQGKGMQRKGMPVKERGEVWVVEREGGTEIAREREKERDGRRDGKMGR